MSDSRFVIDGTATQGLEKKVLERQRKLMRRHQTLLQEIQSYQPQRQHAQDERSYERYLDPVRSHRKGPIGFVANVVLGKLFGAMKIFLRPLLAHQQQQMERLQQAFQEQEASFDHRVQDLKQALGVQNALFSEQVEMMRKDIDDLHQKRFQQMRNALMEIGKNVTGLSRLVSQQQKDVESLEVKQQHLSSTLRAQQKRHRELFDELFGRVDFADQKLLEHETQNNAFASQLDQLLEKLEEQKGAMEESQEKGLRRFRRLQGQLEEALQHLQQLGSRQDGLQHDLHHELQQLREQDAAFQQEHASYDRQYESVYRSVVFLQRYVGDQLTEVDYEKLYQPQYFEGEMYDDYLNAKGVFEQFSVLLEEQFEPTSVLDLGCAYGFIPQYYQEQKDVEAYGIDISEYAVKKLGLPYLQQGDLCDISGPFGDKRFDLILSLETFEHLIPAHVEKALDQIEKHASGYVLLLISTSEVVLDCVDPFHFSLYSREEWDEIFAKRGWLPKLDAQRTTFFNEHTMSHAMKWAGRFWVFDLSS